MLWMFLSVLCGKTIKKKKLLTVSSLWFLKSLCPLSQILMFSAHSSSTSCEVFNLKLRLILKESVILVLRPIDA